MNFDGFVVCNICFAVDKKESQILLQGEHNFAEPIFN